MVFGVLESASLAMSCLMLCIIAGPATIFEFNPSNDKFNTRANSDNFEFNASNDNFNARFNDNNMR